MKNHSLKVELIVTFYQTDEKISSESVQHFSRNHFRKWNEI